MGDLDVPENYPVDVQANLLVNDLRSCTKPATPPISQSSFMLVTLPTLANHSGLKVDFVTSGNLLLDPNGHFLSYNFVKDGKLYFFQTKLSTRSSVRRIC